MRSHFWFSPGWFGGWGGWWGPHDLVVVCQGEGPAVVVGDVVVLVADQGEPVQVGRPAVVPVDQVVGLAPFGRPVTAGVGAAPVAQGEGAPLRGGGGARGPAPVQDLAGPAQ